MHETPRMKKKLASPGIFRILIFLLAFLDSAQGLDLHFKISGGYAYLKLSEVHRSLDSWAEWKKVEAQEKQNWEFLGKNVGTLHSGVDLEGELHFSFAPHMSLGLGAGYIYSDMNEAKAEVKVERPGGTLSEVFPLTVAAYPVTLSGYYFIPLAGNLRMFFRGGFGLVWAKYVNREGSKFLAANNFNYSELHKASASGSILLGGLGLMYDSGTSVRFFVEGIARNAKIREFSVENEQGTKGTLYYFEEYHPDLEFWQAKIKTLAEKPSGTNFRSVSEACVDFSGFSAKIGFMIRF